MPLHIVRNDITKMEVDAIVNAARESLLGGGGVDGAIHRAAGPELLQACRKLNGCPTGKAKITLGYSLPAKYVIHTVGPVWQGGGRGEARLLASCYRKSLLCAWENKCKTVAFPLISSGAYGYPKEEAFRIAVETIQAFPEINEMTVFIVVYDSTSYFISSQLVDDVKQYIDQHYVDEHTDSLAERRRRMHSMCFGELFGIGEVNAAPEDYLLSEAAPSAPPPMPAAPREQGVQFDMWDNLSLEEALNRLDEGFSEMLLRKIDEKGMTDAECYKKANIDRKLFSKIRSDKQYRPSKRTAVALCIALELNIHEAGDLLSKAGIVLSHSNKFDVIIEYFLVKRNFDIFEINETLLYFDQPLLGA